MAEHYTKNTVSVTVWCSKCRKFTEHRVDAGQRGPCVPCMAKPIEAAKPAPAETQGDLFGGTA
jgi:hypothetical protein